MKSKLSNEELFEKYIAGDKSALDVLYSQNIGLIKKKCKQAYDRCGKPKTIFYDDLFQEASVAFMLSVLKYDPETGIKFTTFIGNCIYNYVVDYIRKHLRTQNTEQIKYAKSTYFNDMDLTNDYKCETNILTQDYWQLKTGCFTISAERVFFKNYFSETIKNALDLLSPRQVKVLYYRYGLNDEDNEYDSPHTLAETARYFRLTEKEISKIEKTALKKMRKYCNDRFAYIINNDEKSDDIK